MPDEVRDKYHFCYYPFWMRFHSYARLSAVSLTPGRGGGVDWVHVGISEGVVTTAGVERVVERVEFWNREGGVWGGESGVVRASVCP